MTIDDNVNNEGSGMIPYTDHARRQFNELNEHYTKTELVMYLACSECNSPNYAISKLYHDVMQDFHENNSQPITHYQVRYGDIEE